MNIFNLNNKNHNVNNDKTSFLNIEFDPDKTTIIFKENRTQIEIGLSAKLGRILIYPKSFDKIIGINVNPNELNKFYEDVAKNGLNNKEIKFDDFNKLLSKYFNPNTIDKINDCIKIFTSYKIKHYIL